MSIGNTKAGEILLFYAYRNLLSLRSVKCVTLLFYRTLKLLESQ